MNIASEIISVSVIAVIAVTLIMICLFTFIYDGHLKKTTFSKAPEGTWLFTGFQEKVYDLFYKKAESDKICGIDRKEYERLCAVVHEKPAFKHVVACRLEAVIILLACLGLAYLLPISFILQILFLIIGAAAFYALWFLPYSGLKNRAEEKLFTVRDDLPRFLSLLEKGMDLPIDQAILITATKFKSPLSDDLIESINKVSLGAEGWQKMLVELAKVYDIEDFSDLVLEIVNSYEQGINIRPLVERKAYEVEQNRLYAVEAHDAKIKTMIFLPIIALKVVPLMAMICLPMIGDFIK